MRHIRVQFFLTLGALGTVMPYVSVFFRHAGLDNSQVGYAYAIWSLTAVFSPVVLTRLADGRRDPRGLLAVLSAVSAACLLLLTRVHGVRAVIGVWTLYCLTSMPIIPLQDGVHFALQRRARERGLPPTAYHMVRVWGTIGFVTPGLISFYLLQDGLTLGAVLGLGAAFYAAAAVQATCLDDPKPPPGAADDVARRGVPTWQAVRTMLRPQLLLFCLAVVLAQMVAAVHSAYYPIYLREHVRLSDKWLGPVSNVAVLIEVGLTFACGRLIRVGGVKGVVVSGMVATAVRMRLIASSDSGAVAVASQSLHGPLILATGIVPHTVLDSYADDRFRHSIQGMLVMVTSGGQAVAAVVAGRIVAWSFDGLFNCSAALALVAALLVAAFFREPAAGAKPDPDTEFSARPPIEAV